MRFHKVAAKLRQRWLRRASGQNTNSLGGSFRRALIAVFAVVLVIAVLTGSVRARAGESASQIRPVEPDRVVRTTSPTISPIVLAMRAQASAESYAQGIRLMLANNPVAANWLLLDSLKGPSPWDGVAHCETQSNWQMHGSTYSGGLGFSNKTWSSYMHGLDQHGRRIGIDLRWLGYPENAGDATREQEIVVAERLRLDNGGTPVGAWGCGKYYYTS